MMRCNFIRTRDELLEKKVDALLYESFAERPHDSNQAPSVEDKIVWQKYKKIYYKYWWALPDRTSV